MVLRERVMYVIFKTGIVSDILHLLNQRLIIKNTLFESKSTTIEPDTGLST